MKDRCIICGIKKKLHEVDGMTICLFCFFKNGIRVKSRPFIENLIEEKEGRIKQLEFYFFMKNQLSRSYSDHRYTKKDPKTQKDQEAIQLLLEEVKILKKQKSVRLKYIFEVKNDES